MEIYRSDYVEVYFDDKLSLLKQKYSSKSSSNFEFVKEHKVILERIKTIKPEKFLIDLTARETQVAKKNQSWFTNDIIPEVIKNGLEKVAFIVKDEFDSPVNIEQIAEIESNRIIVPQYFDDMEIAKDWLINA